MKGSAKVIKLLNEVLKAELTAINQYFLHAEMCENWGYHTLGKYTKKEAIEEIAPRRSSDRTHPIPGLSAEPGSPVSSPDRPRCQGTV